VLGQKYNFGTEPHNLPFLYRNILIVFGSALKVGNGSFARSDRGPATSARPRMADIGGPAQHVGKVPNSKSPRRDF
jgi:hypothetical protein